MNSIRTHRHMRRLSLAIAVVMVLSLVPVSFGPAFGDGAKKSVLVFPLTNAAEGAPADVGRSAATALALAISDLPGFEAVQFSTTSATVRRAVSEGRLRQIDIEDENRDLGSSLIIGKALGVDYILIGTVQSLVEHEDPMSVDVMLSGQVYDVAASVDADTGEPLAEPKVDRAFGTTGSSLARARYTGSVLPLIREALDDAAAKAAQALIGRVPEGAVTAKAKKASSTYKWVLLGLLVAGLALAANNSDDGGAGGSSPDALPPRNLVVEDQDGAVRLTWDEPTGTTLTLLRYEIYRATDGGTFSRIDAGDVTAGRTFFNDYSTLSGSHIYQYRMRALYTSGESSPYVVSGAVNVTK